MSQPPARYFLVERYVPSTRLAAIEAATGRVTEVDAADVRHLFTLFVPGEETCLSIFEGADPKAVAAVNRRAGFSYDRIVEIRLLAST